MADTAFCLFIDDLRDSPGVEWVAARSSSEAISLLKERGCPARISFDHDLGGDDTAIVVAKWLIDTDLDCSGRFIPDKFDFFVTAQIPSVRLTFKGFSMRTCPTRQRNEALLEINYATYKAANDK